MPSGADSAVAIITAAYNAERYIGDTLDSVAAQTHPDWTHVVVDDGSTDDTAAIVARRMDAEPRLRLLSQTNSGQAAARNAGLAAAPHDTQYVMFLDADDLLRPEALSNLVDVLQRQSDLDAVHGAAALIDADGNQTAERDRRAPRRRIGRSRTGLRAGARFDPVADDDDTSWDELCVANTITTPGQVLIRRSSLPELPFDPRFVPAEDWALWLELARRRPLRTHHMVVIDYRLHATNQTADWSRMSDAIRRVRAHMARTAAAEAAMRRSVRALAAERIGRLFGELREALRQRDNQTFARLLRWWTRSVAVYAASFLPRAVGRYDVGGARP